MPDREELRRICYELLGRLRGDDPPISQVGFELFEHILTRLDRIETGVYPSNEAPTKPEHISTSQMLSVKVPQKSKE